MERLLRRYAGSFLRALKGSSAYGELRDDFVAHLRATGAIVPQGGLEQFQQDVYTRFAAPGHYYSPIPKYADIVRDQERIFDLRLRELPGVRIDPERFRERLASFAPFYGEFPYGGTADAGLRFPLDNPTYSRGDAVVLYSMMRLHRPNRIVEIGSGMSTLLLLDVNERFLDRSSAITSIDPYPERMLEALREGDRERLEILPQRIQDVDAGRFAQLGAGDIVFVDSTHVTRCDSDVNHIFFTILPSLAPGVLVHFHDMFWPFEYPKPWLLEIGAAWNELYLMRAFLQYNDAFEVDFFCDYCAHFLRGDVERTIPLFLTQPGGSLWLRRAEPR